MPEPDATLWWTVPQAAAWIRTRDRRTVEALDPQQSLSLEMLEQAVPGSIEAAQCLVQALGHGRIGVQGRLALREVEVGTGAVRWRVVDDAFAPISHAFWRTGSCLTDEVDDGIIAQAQGERERWKDLRLNAEDCMGYWPAPATIFEHGSLSLYDAVERLPPEPEDRPIWLLMNPAVRATGLDASRVVVPIDFNRPLVAYPGKNAVATQDGRLSWSAVTLDLAARGKPHGRVGRRAEWDWEEAFINLMVMVADTPDGLPKKQADAERFVAQYFADHNDGESPAESAIRERVGRIYKLRRQRSAKA